MYEQTIVGANIASSEGLFELPGGSMGVAFGYEYIDNDFEFIPSQDLAAGTIAGFNGQPPTAGGFDVHSVYGELYFPILSGEPGAELLDVTVAARYSDYSTIGDVTTYKVDASWAPTADIRFRAGFNTANRAPGVGELFAPQGEGFPAAVDFCAANSPAETQTQAVADICTATGVPAGSVFTPAIDPAAGQVRELSGGNPDLTDEEAETFTVGVVLTPSAVEGLSLSLDYFDIDIDDYIDDFGGGAANVLNVCYTNTELGGVGSPFCNIVNRRPDGTIDFVSVTEQNVASRSLKGFDLVAEYGFDLADGYLALAYVGTYTTESEFVAFEGDDTIECEGRFGQLFCDDPLPEYKHRMAATYNRGPLTAQLLWRFIGEVEDDDPGREYTIEEIDAEHYFDLSGSYDFGNGIAANFGIDNLFDNKPPIIGDNQEQANTYPATYDVFGRTYFLRLSAQF